MALIKFGGGVAGISGKIAGTVFARNKAGAYARNWAKPVNPGTPSQAAVRSIFANGSAAWNGLSNTQRDSWNAAAADIERINRFGETYKPSGRQYFLEQFNSLQQAGLGFLNVPPVTPTAPDMPQDGVLTATAAAGVLTVLSLAISDPSVGDNFIVDGAPPSTDAKTNVNTKYRQIIVEATGGSPYNLLAAYTSLFGTAAPAGNIIRIRLTVVDSGTGLRSAQFLLQDSV